MSAATAVAEQIVASVWARASRSRPAAAEPVATSASPWPASATASSSRRGDAASSSTACSSVSRVAAQRPEHAQGRPDRARGAPAAGGGELLLGGGQRLVAAAEPVERERLERPPRGVGRVVDPAVAGAQLARQPPRLLGAALLHEQRQPARAPEARAVGVGQRRPRALERAPGGGRAGRGELGQREEAAA